MKKSDALPNCNEGKIDGKYYLSEILGSGSSSTVYKATDSSGNEEYAIKVMKGNYICDKDFFDREVIMSKVITHLESPFFVKYKTSSFSGKLVQKEGESSKPYIVFELADKGSTIDYIMYNNLGLNEKLSKYFFSKILQIVKYLHENGICHRDLKLDNFLFDGDNFSLKLSDFGFASFIFQDNDKKIKIMQNEKCGTKSYMAPELYTKENFIQYDGEKVDIFSLGVILFNLRTCKWGFVRALSNDPLYKYIKKGKISEYWSNLEKVIQIDGLTEDFKNLYIKMVSPNPNERPTLEQIYNHEWFKEIRDLSQEELAKYEEEFISELKSREK